MSGVVLERARRWTSLALIVLAAIGIVRAMDARRQVPEVESYHQFQVVLDELAVILAPVEGLVPEGEPLRYVRPLDAQGQPIYDDAAFALVAAVLAPRRIGRDVDARFLLAHYRNAEGWKQTPGLEHARVLAQLSPPRDGPFAGVAGGLALMERDAH